MSTAAVTSMVFTEMVLKTSRADNRNATNRLYFFISFLSLPSFDPVF